MHPPLPPTLTVLFSSYRPQAILFKNSFSFIFQPSYFLPFIIHFFFYFQPVSYKGEEGKPHGEHYPHQQPFRDNMQRPDHRCTVATYNRCGVWCLMDAPWLENRILFCLDFFNEKEPPKRKILQSNLQQVILSVFPTFRFCSQSYLYNNPPIWKWEKFECHCKTGRTDYTAKGSKKAKHTLASVWIHFLYFVSAFAEVGGVTRCVDSARDAT